MECQKTQSQWLNAKFQRANLYNISMGIHINIFGFSLSLLLSGKFVSGIKLF